MFNAGIFSSRDAGYSSLVVEPGKLDYLKINFGDVVHKRLCITKGLFVKIGTGHIPYHFDETIFLHSSHISFVKPSKAEQLQPP